MPYIFKFLINHHLHFEAPLESEQCVATTNSGQRCKRNTVIGCGYCYTHLLKLKHLRIKTSTIEGAGKGLFALDPTESDNAIIFKKDDKIIKYDGELVDRDELDERYGGYTAPYGVEISRTKDEYEDGALHRGVGTLVNHSTRDANCRFSVTRNGNIVLKATRNIRNNKEILVDYGRNYNFNEDTSYKTTYDSRR